jgi:hypothetical protein
MSPVLNAVLIVVQMGLLAFTADRARRAQLHEIDARYEAEYARRCAMQTRTAARYSRATAAYLSDSTGVPLPAVLARAWAETGIGSHARMADGEEAQGGPMTPA